MISNQKMFEFMYEAVLSEGGDGDLTLVLLCQKFKDVADEFEKFLGSQEVAPWHRVDQESYIIFYHDQEGFTITNDRRDKDESIGYTQMIVTL